MKTRLFLSLIASISLCQCLSPGGSTTSALAADAAITLNVATQYELAAKDHTITPAEYTAIAQSALDQYTLTHPGTDTATLKSLLATATQAVQLYDLTRSKPKASAFVLPRESLSPVCAFDAGPPGLPVSESQFWRIAFALPAPAVR